MVIVIFICDMSDRIEDVRTISVIRLPDGNNIIPTVNRNERKQFSPLHLFLF